MVEVYKLQKSPCTVIRSSKELKFLIYDNGDHFNLTHLVLSPSGDVIRKGYTVIPKNVAEEIAKALLDGGKGRTL